MLKGEIFVKKVKNITAKSGLVPCKFVIKVCDCCGAEEEVRYHNYIKKQKKGDYCRKCMSSYKKPKVRGQQHGNYKETDNHSYYKIRTREDGKRQALHRYLYEKNIGRKLSRKEKIHHIDMDKQNNDIDNLFLFPNMSQHTLAHQSMEKCGYNLLNNIIWFSRVKKSYTFKKSAEKYAKKNEGFDIEICSSKPIKKSKNKRGNYYIKRQIDGKVREVHIYIAEKVLGRKMFRDECVHHIDGNKYNNYPENLIVMTKKEHRYCHSALQLLVAELYKQNIVSFDKKNEKYFVVDK